MGRRTTDTDSKKLQVYSIRQTRARSRLDGAPRLMDPLENNRGCSVTDLPAEPDDIPSVEVSRRLIAKQIHLPSASSASPSGSLATKTATTASGRRRKTKIILRSSPNASETSIKDEIEDEDGEANEILQANDASKANNATEANDDSEADDDAEANDITDANDVSARVPIHGNINTRSSNGVNGGNHFPQNSQRASRGSTNNGSNVGQPSGTGGNGSGSDIQEDGSDGYDDTSSSSEEDDSGRTEASSQDEAEQNTMARSTRRARPRRSTRLGRSGRGAIGDRRVRGDTRSRGRGALMVDGIDPGTNQAQPAQPATPTHGFAGRGVVTAARGRATRGPRVRSVRGFEGVRGGRDNAAIAANAFNPVMTNGVNGVANPFAVSGTSRAMNPDSNVDPTHPPIHRAPAPHPFGLAINQGPSQNPFAEPAVPATPTVPEFPIIPAAPTSNLFTTSANNAFVSNAGGNEPEDLHLGDIELDDNATQPNTESGADVDMESREESSSVSEPSTSEPSSEDKADVGTHSFDEQNTSSDGDHSDSDSDSDDDDEDDHSRHRGAKRHRRDEDEDEDDDQSKHDDKRIKTAHPTPRRAGRKPRRGRGGGRNSGGYRTGTLRGRRTRNAAQPATDSLSSEVVGASGTTAPGISLTGTTTSATRIA